MIKLQNVSVQYGNHPALEKIDFTVQASECILITGPSGCGKSTLARVIAGLIPQAIPAQVEGSATVAGFDALKEPISVLAQQVGMVFQNPSSQLFHLRVEDEVAFGLRNLGVEEAEINNRVAWALIAVGLSGFEDKKPMELSGGQKQKLAIAAVLAMRPQILVLDEPTASLDIAGTQQVIGVLKALHKQHKITIILIEHRLAEAVALADRVVLMEQGRIIADGSANKILTDQQTRNRLGLRRPAEQTPLPWNLLTENCSPASAESAGRQPLLALNNVTAGYSSKAVIHDVDLAIYPNDFVALVGNNGAGKSTVSLIAAGLTKPLGGNVQYSGGQKPRPGLDVALLFQNPTDQLFTNSVDAEVSFGPQNYNIFDEIEHQKTLTVADLLPLKKRQPLSLSIGQQQRTALAACLALRPQLVILDEPTLGQDWGHLQQLMDFLVTLNQNGTAILLITHDYKLIHRYARRVVLMDNGRIIRDGCLQKPQ